MAEQIILVDEQDNAIGQGEKMEVHQKGLLHRAFSILIFNHKGELLIQQRAKDKYHCPGLWANTCCSHPRWGESLEEASTRRLKEEMGFVCKLNRDFSFIYKVKFDNGLTEHEYDHVFVGFYDGELDINKDEVQAYEWVNIAILIDNMKKYPNKYAPWFKIIMDKYKR